MSRDASAERGPGWPRVPLSQVAAVNPESLGSRTPMDLRFGYIDLSSVSGGHVSWSDVSEQVFSTAPSRARRRVEPGDVLFGTVRPANRSHGYVSKQERELVASTGFAVLRAQPGVADSRFLFHFILSEDASDQARRVEVGSNYPAVNESDIARFDVPLPRPSEQRRIADILDTLDEAIRKTEQVIAKLQQMKQGLLHDLLTRGLDDNGELRDPDRHPEQFKNSPLGRIPKAWGISALGQVTSWLSGGTPSKTTPSYWTGMIPWVSPKDMKYFRVGDAQDHISEAGVVAGSRVVPPESILVVVRGMILAHTFPVCLTTAEVAFNQDVKAVLPGDTVSGTFLAHWFVGYSKRLLGLVTEATHGTKRIDLKEIQAFPIALPSRGEQLQVAEILDNQDERIASERTTLAKLRALKQGLMDDLLTGRVRVNVPEESHR